MKLSTLKKFDFMNLSLKALALDEALNAAGNHGDVDPYALEVERQRKDQSVFPSPGKERGGERGAPVLFSIQFFEPFGPSPVS